MTKTLSLKAEKRDIFGKAVDKIRGEGRLPAVLYGPKEKSQAIFVSTADFKKIWKEAGESSVVALGLGEENKDVLIHEVDLDPLKQEPRHVDFYAVDITKATTVVVPLEFEGEAPAVKNLGGILVKVLHEIEIEALPKDLPHEIKVDVSSLENFDEKITIADLKMPSGVKALGNPEETVVLTAMPKEEDVPEVAPTIADIEVASEKKEEKEEEKSEEEKEKRGTGKEEKK